MNKVFIVVASRWDSYTDPTNSIEKVLSSREKAEQWIKKHKEEHCVYFSMQEWIIDEE